MKVKFSKIVLVGLFLIISLFAKAERPFPSFFPLSEQSKISLLTCDPGNQLYTTFGHSAIRVYDPMQGRDVVFNYGTFNFNVPNFYVKFASGKLMYRLSFESYRQFMAMYAYESRTVIEQELLLTRDQKELLLAKIRENYKIENRFYKYDFFFDNCATRIIDIFEDTFADDLVCRPVADRPDKTFRELLNEYLGNSDWSNVGINLLLGKVTDVPATDLEKSFLPDYLLQYFETLEMQGNPFVSRERHLIKGTFEMPKTPLLVSPKLWSWVLLLIVIVFSIIYKSKSWFLADKSIFVLFGFIGLLVFLTNFATDHEAMKENMNLLWVNPLYLVLSAFIGSKYWKVTLGLSLFLLISNIIVLLGWDCLPQTFHSSFIPLILLLSIRLCVISLKYRYK